MSFSGTPNLTRLRYEEKEKPVTESTLPSASMGSLVGKPTGSTLILLMSKPFAYANEGNWAHAPSGGGAPKTDPIKSDGLLIPRDFLPTTAKGGLS